MNRQPLVAMEISNAASRGFGTVRGAWSKEYCTKYLVLFGKREIG